jgi:hypothetical protein
VLRSKYEAASRLKTTTRPSTSVADRPASRMRVLLTERLKERPHCEALTSDDDAATCRQSYNAGEKRCSLQSRVDIGRDHSNEKPSFERGWPGAAGSAARGEPSVEFAPDPVVLTIGSFVKAGASQAGRASEELWAALFGRICDLHTTSLASMRSGQRWQERSAACARAGAWHLIPCMIRFFSICGGNRQ